MDVQDEVVIQKRIEETMKEQFDKLLEDSKDDVLLKLLIEEKLNDYSVEEIKSMVFGD